MSRPWMPLYVADYLADTGHLSTIEHGAYMLLIMHYWATGGLPNDDKRLASIARASLEQWSDMRATLAEFFGDGWKHERIDTELENAARAYEKRAAAGKAGGKAKAGKASIAVALPEQSYSQPPKIAVASATDAGASDPRDALWREGVSSLKAMTGKTDSAARALVGKWLAASKDDCALVLSKIRTAQAERIGESVAWITAALKPPPTAPPAPRNAGERAFLRLQAENGHDPTNTASKRLEPGDGRRQIEGNGDAWPLASSQGAF